MTYTDFRAWKIAMAKRSLARARQMNSKGQSGTAAWHLHLAALARLSLAGA